MGKPDYFTSSASTEYTRVQVGVKMIVAASSVLYAAGLMMEQHDAEAAHDLLAQRLR